jgi:hypothetical protein
MRDSHGLKLKMDRHRYQHPLRCGDVARIAFHHTERNFQELRRVAVDDMVSVYPILDGF